MILSAVSDRPFEGRQALKNPGDWQREHRIVPAGSLFVPIAQAHVQLLATLFEPKSEDSFLQWGFFNAHFETKEYMEDYVTEAFAEEALKDAKIHDEFAARLKDKAFANDPQARLEFFYRHHPSWDERRGLYPVYKTDRDRTDTGKF